ncbi:zinc finger protein 398-like isoform X3 [Columba livia]|uniref:zinc finger protein 398-like isoform X3 n=1 Tax=Columba livia TaxID=8932 RepID=UPI0031BABDF2
MAGPRLGRAEAVAARLLRLETRLARAERQLRGALALRGRLRALERRLENGGGAPRVPARRGAAGAGRGAARGPVSPEDVWVQFSEREWRALRGWQRALHRAVLRRNYHMLLPTEPDVPRRAQARWGHGNQPCRSCGDGDGRGDLAESGTEDSIIHIKQEEELCAADEQEEEAGEAPGEPCPEQALYEPEAPGPPGKGEALDPRGPAGAGAQEPPGDPDPGFQTYATDALSWIKQEEEPRCPERRRSEEEETSTHSSTAHDENAKRDPPSDCFESTACDSGVPARPAEKFSKDAVPGVTWDAPCNSEIMETNPMGNGLGGDARSDRGFAEHFDFFSAQENSVGKRPCERNPSQQEHLQGAREEEKSLSERMFHLLHSCASGERGAGQGAAAAPCEGPPERRLDPADGAGLGDRGGLAGEEQPPAQGEETFPAENPPGSPCWEPRPDKPGPWGRCRQHSGGSAANQQPGQGRGKSYICSDCGKSFICHSWLVRHQMTHTGERPYKCSECDKSYRRKDYLLNHQRQHSGERLFQCPLCRKRFVRRRSFMKHQESHVQETHLTLGGWPCAELRGSVMHSI